VRSNAVAVKYRIGVDAKTRLVVDAKREGTSVATLALRALGSEYGVEAEANHRPPRVDGTPSQFLFLRMPRELRGRIMVDAHNRGIRPGEMVRQVLERQLARGGDAT
jgi:hypothetical protein